MSECGGLLLREDSPEQGTRAATFTEERRRVQRTRTDKCARILLDRDAAVIECIVRDLTNLGAGLVVASSAGVPETFELVFGSVHARRPCRVVWRTENRLEEILTGWVLGTLEDGDEQIARAEQTVVEIVCGGLAPDRQAASV